MKQLSQFISPFPGHRVHIHIMPDACPRLSDPDRGVGSFPAPSLAAFQAPTSQLHLSPMMRMRQLLRVQRGQRGSSVVCCSSHCTLHLEKPRSSSGPASAPLLRIALSAGLLTGQPQRPTSAG